jgi:hypothetical protein
MLGRVDKAGVLQAERNVTGMNAVRLCWALCSKELCGEIRDAEMIASMSMFFPMEK